MLQPGRLALPPQRQEVLQADHFGGRFQQPVRARQEQIAAFPPHLRSIKLEWVRIRTNWSNRSNRIQIGRDQIKMVENQFGMVVFRWKIEVNQSEI